MKGLLYFLEGHSCVSISSFKSSSSGEETGFLSKADHFLKKSSHTEPQTVQDLCTIFRIV